MKLDNEIDWETFPYREYPVMELMAQTDSAIINISERLASFQMADGQAPEGNPYPDPELWKSAMLGELERFRIKRELLYRIEAMQDLGV